MSESIITEHDLFYATDWTSLIQNLLSKDKGLCIFVFPIPKDTSAFERFPEPTIPEEWGGDHSGNGFLDWSDGVMRASVSPLVFNPKVHAYCLTHGVPPALIVGVIGPLGMVYKWAEAFLKSVSKEPRFHEWIEEAIWMTHEDLLALESGETLESPEEEEHEVDNYGKRTSDKSPVVFPKVIDIEDDKTVIAIADSMYDGSKPLTKAEETELHEAIQE
jgi:hypothetical protein